MWGWELKKMISFEESVKSILASPLWIERNEFRGWIWKMDSDLNRLWGKLKWVGIKIWTWLCLSSHHEIFFSWTKLPCWRRRLCFVLFSVDCLRNENRSVGSSLLVFIVDLIITTCNPPNVDFLSFFYVRDGLSISNRIINHG